MDFIREYEGRFVLYAQVTGELQSGNAPFTALVNRLKGAGYRAYALDRRIQPENQFFEREISILYVRERR